MPEMIQIEKTLALKLLSTIGMLRNAIEQAFEPDVENGIEAVVEELKVAICDSEVELTPEEEPVLQQEAPKEEVKEVASEG